MTTAAHKPAPATWARSPQRVWLRRALFQIHLWIGLIIALYAIVIGLTGSILVFKDEIERAQRPGVFHVQRATPAVTLDAVIHTIEQAHPGWRVFALRNMDKLPHGQATDALLLRRGAPPSQNYRIVSFNPANGEVLADHMRYDGWLGVCDNLHVYLLAEHTGLVISGWMAVGMLILTVSGLVLWWPGVERWITALVFHARSSWRRINWDLHTVVGFWASALLLVITFTGVDFAFPDTLGNTIEIVTGGSLAQRQAADDATHRPVPHRSDGVLTADAALAAAAGYLPKDAPAGFLSLPATPSSAYRVTGYYTAAAPFSQLVRAELDPHTGQLLGMSSTHDQTRGLRTEQYFATVHFGSFGRGPLKMAIKVVWALAGLAPVLLAITGVLMFWNRTLRHVFRRTSLPPQ